MITTCSEIPGYTVTRIHDLVSIKLTFSNVLIAGQKPRHDAAWDATFSDALLSLEKKALSLGANAVVGVQQNVLAIPGLEGLLLLVLTGTAVTAEPKSPD